jgi:hypothetical protein
LSRKYCNDDAISPKLGKLFLREKAARGKEKGQSEWPRVEDLSKERHYSIDEISTLWGLSHKTIPRIFPNEPGVVEL